MRLEIKAPYTTVHAEAVRILAKEDLALLSIRPVSRETGFAETSPMNDMSAAETFVEAIKFVAAVGSAYKVLRELAEGLRKLLGKDAVKEIDVRPEAQPSSNTSAEDEEAERKKKREQDSSQS